MREPYSPKQQAKLACIVQLYTRNVLINALVRLRQLHPFQQTQSQFSCVGTIAPENKEQKEDWSEGRLEQRAEKGQNIKHCEGEHQRRYQDTNKC
jgi:hypothetical protein